MKTLKITITQEDIDHATNLRASSQPVFNCVMQCPIAIAGTRAGGVQAYVGIGRFRLQDSVMFSEENIKFKGALPEIAKKFQTSFDNGEHVEPIEFEIEHDRS